MASRLAFFILLVAALALLLVGVVVFFARGEVPDGGRTQRVLAWLRNPAGAP